MAFSTAPPSPTRVTAPPTSPWRRRSRRRSARICWRTAISRMSLASITVVGARSARLRAGPRRTVIRAPPPSRRSRSRLAVKAAHRCRPKVGSPTTRFSSSTAMPKTAACQARRTPRLRRPSRCSRPRPTPCRSISQRASAAARSPKPASSQSRSTARPPMSVPHSSIPACQRRQRALMATPHRLNGSGKFRLGFGPPSTRSISGSTSPIMCSARNLPEIVPLAMPTP